MLLKDPKFLDAMCKVYQLSRNWRLVRIADYGDFICHENEPDNVYKVYNLDLWMEEKKVTYDSEPVDCEVRNILSSKAKITPLVNQSIEVWLNIVIPHDAKQQIRVEPYLDQGDALNEAEQELLDNFEVHTRRIVVKVP